MMNRLLNPYVGLLSHPEREVMKLFLEGYDHDEVCAKLDHSSQDVARLYNGSVAKLKSAFASDIIKDWRRRWRVEPEFPNLLKEYLKMSGISYRQRFEIQFAMSAPSIKVDTIVVTAAVWQVHDNLNKLLRKGMY
jgi:hypothetical protein